MLWCCLDYSHKPIQIAFTLCGRVSQTKYKKDLKNLLDINIIKYSWKKTLSSKITLRNFNWFIQNSKQISFYQSIFYVLFNCNVMFLNVEKRKKNCRAMRHYVWYNYSLSSIPKLRKENLLQYARVDAILIKCLQMCKEKREIYD